MASEVKLPRLGQGMESGTIVRWLKSEGEPVAKGDPLYELDTDKVTQEVEAEATGVLLKIVIADGEVDVGTTVGVIGAQDEDVSELLAASQGGNGGAPATVPDAAAPARAADQPRGSEPQSAMRDTAVSEIATSAGLAGERMKASPLARRMARERGVDLAIVTGTGPEGRIVREDVERAIATKSQEPRAESRVDREAFADSIPLAGIRKVIFDRMGQSWREAARVTLFADADMSELVTLRQARLAVWERRFGIKPSYSDLIHLAVARALREEPRINCRLDGQAVRIRKEVNLAFAVDLGEGLVAAVIRDADKQSLGDLARAARDLADRARSGRLSPDEMADGTFTVTNLGTVGVEYFTPIINPPQAGILGVGKIMEKPVVLHGGIHVRSMMTLSLVFDHRLIDGAPAARFLAKVKELLEQPAWMG